MAAQLIQIFEPASEDERAAVAYLAERLPKRYTVIANSWVAERTGQVFEVDTVVIAPHAIFVVEVKYWRGRIEGNDVDWYVDGEPRPSPLSLNRRTAQILASRLRDYNYRHRELWVENLVFLAHPISEARFRTPTAKAHVHTRETIIPELTDRARLQKRVDKALVDVDDMAVKTVLRILQADADRPPRRRIREYDLGALREATDTYQEYEVTHRLDNEKRLLRIYQAGGTPEAARKTLERCGWEARILRRLGSHPGILRADAPFEVQETSELCVAFEHFTPSVTLTSWIEKRREAMNQAGGLHQRLRLFLAILDAVQFAHGQGVVHRLLRPDVIRVEDKGATKLNPAGLADEKVPPIRVTGFDLAKRLDPTAGTVASSLFTEERMVHAAPEVVRRPADATPASDQYSLGAILFFLLTGERAKPTSAVMSNHDLLALPSELVPRLPRELDDITFKMLDPVPGGRFEDLEAVRAQILQILGERVSLQRGSPTDPDDLAPGTELGSDYVVKGLLGRGGLSTVYLVDHRPSGTDRALKIARADQGAEDALRSEFKALHELNHPNLVKAVDLTKLVQNRLTLVLERVPGESLRARLRAKVDIEPRLRRRFAEDLLSVLQYFEREEIVHKDLKPENLLVSNEDGLTVIDLSLVEVSRDDLGVGTGAYRDPALKAWDYGSDRYAAALCLFELHSGAHPFDHGPPEPGRVPETDPEWFDQPGLATFFTKALHPDPAHRFPSATAMLEAYRASLGPAEASDESGALPTGSETVTAATPLTRLELSARALNALRRGGVHSAGDLVGMSEPQLRRLPNVGNRVFRQITRVQQRLVDAGLQATKPGRQPERRMLYPQLADRKEALDALNLGKGELAALREGGFQTIGSVASSTRDEILSVRGIGRERLAGIVRQLVAFDVGDSQTKVPQTLDDFWSQATAPLSEEERTGLARRLAIFGGSPETQGDIGSRLGMSQPQVSILLQRARESIKPEVLAHPIDLLEGWLEQLGGIVALHKAGERLEKRWPPEQISGEGFVRLLAELHPIQVKVVETSRLLGGPCVLGPEYERDDVTKFLEAAERLAEGWPQTSADAVRRGLQGLLPHYTLDPCRLVGELSATVRATATGELYTFPPKLDDALGWVLGRERLPLPLDQLPAKLRESFPDEAGLGLPDGLQAHVERLGYGVQDGQINRRQGGGITPLPGPERDPLPPVLRRPQRSPEQVMGELLRGGISRGGFQLLVTPPDKHAEIGPSIARALGARATYVSFEGALLDALGPSPEAFARAVRAEKFKAQRPFLSRSVEELMARLLERHGRPGQAVVLGDTALLELCDATDWIRRLYDEVQDGTRGLWVLVIPGTIHRNQPRFNDRLPVWHLDGQTLPLLAPIPAEVL